MNRKEIFSAKLKENSWEVSAHSLLSFIEYAIQGILREQLEQYAKPHETIFSEHVVFKNVIEIDLKNYFLESFKIRRSDIKLVLKPKYRKLVDWDLFKKTLQERKIDEEFPSLYSHRSPRWSLYVPRESNIVYLPPFRGYPKRLYVQNVDENPLDTFTVNSDMMVAYDYSFEDDSVKKDSLKTAFNYWVAEHFELGDKVTVEDRVNGLASEIFVWQDQKKIPIINVGFGASQILPVIFKILVNQKKSLFVIDEPEIHLHPSLQSKLADFFFRMAFIGKRIFIETHSEYLLDRMIYLSIKYEKYSKGNVFLDWVKKVDGESSFERIEYDSLGYLQNAPKGFLNEKQVLVEEINALRVNKIM